MRLKRVLQSLAYGRVPGGKCYCVLCGHRVWRFLPYRDNVYAELLASLRLVGSDVRCFACPRCGSHDRERHLLLYLQATGLLSSMAGKVVVHFAPERRLSHKIAAQNLRSYVRCDLFPSRAGIDRVDLLAMPFPKASVDVLIANHVLEHVSDDMDAVKEICRVLVPGGIAILQTPYSPTLERTFEDPEIREPLHRLRAYGQEDHVRLFGGDVFDRIGKSGLVPETCAHATVLREIDHVEFGVNPEEPFFLFRKPAGIG